ncbi:hypothetical protein HORM4_840030 [Vibrio harveyi]|nr:hypothetical protein HORM4_840030 [Vibrio harveyi]
MSLPCDKLFVLTLIKTAYSMYISFLICSNKITLQKWNDNLQVFRFRLLKLSVYISGETEIRSDSVLIFKYVNNNYQIKFNSVY